MKYQDFKEVYLLIADCETEGEFIAEAGLHRCFSEYNSDAVVTMLKKMYVLKNKNLKCILAITGMTQAKMSREYSISIRTIESWVAEVRTPPEYVYLMLAYAIFSDAEII